MRPRVYQAAKPLVAVARVHEQHVRALLVVVAHEVVGEERFAAARRAEHELVAVCRYAAPHRLVADVNVYGHSAATVGQAYAERAWRAAVVRLGCKQTHGLFEERVEALLRREIGCVAGYARPEERGAVNGVVPRRASHLRELPRGVVARRAKLRLVLRPRHHVAVAAHGHEAFCVGLVEEHLRPFSVHGVSAAVARKRQQVA